MFEMADLWQPARVLSAAVVAQVDRLETRPGSKKAVVNYWREGAVFGSAPVGPLKPLSV
jgi:hypothetical protein